jgi:hypothetical protein
MSVNIKSKYAALLRVAIIIIIIIITNDHQTCNTIQ